MQSTVSLAVDMQTILCRSESCNDVERALGRYNISVVSKQRYLDRPRVGTDGAGIDGEAGDTRAIDQPLQIAADILERPRSSNPARQELFNHCIGAGSLAGSLRIPAGATQKGERHEEQLKTEVDHVRCPTSELVPRERELSILSAIAPMIVCRYGRGRFSVPASRAQMKTASNELSTIE